MLDFTVKENIQLNQTYFLIKLTPKNGEILTDMEPGQFVEVLVENSPRTFLRRPISVNFVEKDKNLLWLLVQAIGDGTRKMSQYVEGDVVNLLVPLGKGFTISGDAGKKSLLVGGGVGTAPLLYLGYLLKRQGQAPIFLLGARSKSDLTLLNEFEKYGEVFCTTEDGSFGEKGYVTNHSRLNRKDFSMIYTCGPKPMMQAVAKYAKQNKIACEVSLENMMGCGIGTCLCCVEKTSDGHICVCTEGPVFNIDKLTWAI
ncbi:MAG: dihydroorotate dehydrogenase electron transfer subunit [Bacteroidetes bacterium]|nr:dihydroorotate dehydrogenase electron transfer subunit [Bacteroidota bacterium]